MTLLFNIGFLQITWVDVADVLLVSFLIYQLYKVIRGSVAFRIAIGILAIYLVYLIVKAAKMELLTAILGQFIGVGVIAALILFQQEIRKFLLLIGKSSIFSNDNIIKAFFRRENKSGNLNILPIIEAIKVMAGQHTGGLIVFSRDNDLKFYAESGDSLDALISKRLLLSIFNKYSPMHDGAVIVTAGRISAARCILPVSDDADLPAQYGLRHRAALGLTEITDALVLVVSEETGQISLSYNGKLEANLSPVELKHKLNQYLLEKKEIMEPVLRSEPVTA